jgi:hypothetical protein
VIAWCRRSGRETAVAFLVLAAVIAVYLAATHAL